MQNQLLRSDHIDNVVFLPKSKSIPQGVRWTYCKISATDASIIRALDVLISLTVIVLLAPIIVLIYALIFATDRVDPIFAQSRLGASYRTFRCLKFRTMRPNSEHVLEAYLKANPAEAEIWQRFRKLKRDPRVTLIGRILRKSSLDELPQLFNVLKGEMSLVGPRPIMLNEIETYGRSLRIYTSVKPGITGFWQIRGRNRLTYRQRIACDRIFVRQHDLGFYMHILFNTIPAVVFQKGSS